MVSNLINANPDTFAVVEYHVSDGYATQWGNQRATFYGGIADGVPWFAYDGLWDAWPINTYASKLAQRAAVSTPVTMEVTCNKLSGNTHRITLHVCLEAGAAATTMRLYAVVAEDHYPASPTYCRNTFRAATAVLDITLQPGECYTDVREIDMDPTWDPENLRIIAWAQTPATQYPALVFQACQTSGPFQQALFGDLDGDCDVDIADLAELLSNYGTTSGAVYEDGDLDEDGDVDLADLAALLAQYGKTCI